MMRRKQWIATIWRRLLIALLLVGQLWLLFFLVARGTTFVTTCLQLVSVFVCLYMIGRPGKDGIKLSWVFLILLVPVFGGIFYILLKATAPRHWLRDLNARTGQNRAAFRLPGERLEEACGLAPECGPQLRYLEKCCGYPVYRNTQAEYLPSGEEKFRVLLRELKKAKRYIFLEYFIIEPGRMWSAILDVLKEKAAAGVDVRLIYDDLGCILRLPGNYPRELAGYGIRCACFNPFRPFLSSVQNNRDHRKLACIDGEVAFTGGVNLADEYINAVPRFGHWRDAAVVLRGDGAWGLTMLFLEMWSALLREPTDFSAFYPGPAASFQDAPGMVQPYADSPLDDENVGEHVYRQIIENAKNYVYISTPYLIPDETLLSALAVVAKGGVDVRILTPKRWDKRLVHMTTRSYYPQLLAAGVRIYEYTPGFNHAKTFVADDTVGTVGTVNLDYRSLYLHFECGVWMYGTQAVGDMKEDFLRTLEKSEEIRLNDCRAGLPARLFREILHVFAPLM